TSGSILVELPGAKDVDRVKNLLQSTAQLEFWETFKAEELNSFMIAANNKLIELEGVNEKEEAQEDDESASEIDSLLSDAVQDSADVASQVNPLYDLMVSGGMQGSPIIARVAIKDTAKFNDYLEMPEIRQLLPANLQYVEFGWGIAPKDSQVLDLYALKGNRENTPNMNGDVITDAQQTYDIAGRPAVSMQMNNRGAKIWEELTGKAFREGGNIAIVLDNVVYSAPGVSKG